MIDIDKTIIDINDDVKFDLKTSSFLFNGYNCSNSEREEIQKTIDKNIITRRLNRFNGRRVITALNLIPTMKCNGFCLYCYNEENNNQIDDMLSIDTVYKNVKKLEKLYDISLKECRIYGGEPFLNSNIFSIMKTLYHDYKIQFYISSGLLFDKKTFKTVLSNLKDVNYPLSLGISLDLGCKDVYTRHNALGLNLKNLLERAQKINENTIIPTILVTTISKFTDIITLKSDIEYCLDNLPQSCLRFATACDELLYPDIDLIDDVCELLEKYIDNPKITSNIFPYYDVINSQHVVKITDNCYNIVFNDTSCGVFSNMINMLPNGNLIHCHMNPYDATFDINKFDKRDDITLSSECHDCDYWRVCRGGCYYRKLTGTQSKKSYCYWIKKSFILALRRLFAAHPNLKGFLEKTTSENQFLL